ncbi:hypothetical protein APX70_200561 [Pseudomonas syringae pv. maculicola]|uniref:Uncharacterized protein n=1 Tax=Pseudomonas syringae pv. maculicola TaxID=59511 RepID=A0A3M2XG23_PSEYM|nr:hypothetical protein APX70_200561 [Pseudomonas syringae pv. maculicola]
MASSAKKDTAPTAVFEMRHSDHLRNDLGVNLSA